MKTLLAHLHTSSFFPLSSNPKTEADLLLCWDFFHGAKTLTKFDIGAGFAALVRVQDQKANFEEEAVRGHVETTHLVETVTAHHERNEPYSFTQHLDVMNYPVDSCLKGHGDETKEKFNICMGDMFILFTCQTLKDRPILPLPHVHSKYVSHWIPTKLTVTVILSLLLLLPALAHAEGVVREVRLCGGGDEQRTGWRDEDEKKRE